jgi:hypothetical protein
MYTVHTFTRNSRRSKVTSESPLDQARQFLRELPDGAKPIGLAVDHGDVFVLCEEKDPPHLPTERIR